MKNKGITLIALVITIIVLLILAGVTIVTLTGDNGILNQAQKAKNMTNKNVVEEEIQVEVLGSYNNSGELDLVNLNDNLMNNLSGVKHNKEQISESNKIKNLPAVIEYNGYTIIIAENTVTVAEESVKVGEKVKKTVKYNYNDGVTAATIPAGFEVSEKENEQKIEKGLVIKDSKEDNGNEFVWIPCTLIQYKNAKNAVMKNNWLHDINYKPVVEENGLAWKDDYTEADIKNITEEYNKRSTEGSISPLEDIISNLEKNQTSVAEESIRKYGGFYIARYEAGVPDDSVGSYGNKVETNKEGLNKIKDLSPVSKKNVQVWNFITQPNAKIVAENMYETSDAVGSYLVDSQAWNHICENIFGKITEKNITDSSDWGNYDHKNGYQPINTGLEEGYENYNIYDMAGNVWEYTTEHNIRNNDNLMHFVIRGRLLYGQRGYIPSFRCGC